MTTWSGTLRSLFLGPWWWFPSAFFAPWWFSVFFLGLFGVSVAYAIGMGDSELFLVLPVYVTSGWVGWWGRRLHGWENAVLVPDLPRHLFVVCLAMVTGVALVFAAFSMYMGDPSPPLGQAVLLGVGVVYGSVCLSGVMAALVVSSPCLLSIVSWDGVPLLWLAVEHPAVPVPAFALSLILVELLRRGLASPGIEHVSDAAHDPVPDSGRRRMPATAKFVLGFTLVGFVPEALGHLSGYPYLSFLEVLEGPAFGYERWFFASGMIIMFPSAILAIAAEEYPVAWLMGTAGTRVRVAWKLVGRTVVAGVLSLLLVFLAMEAAWSVSADRDPRFDQLLESQILAFLAFGFTYAFRRRYPNWLLDNAYFFPTVYLWFFGQHLWHSFDLALPVLGLLVIGSGAAAAAAVSHGLARADCGL